MRRAEPQRTMAACRRTPPPASRKATMRIPSGLQGIGIPFYSAEQWLKAKNTFPDGHTFHPTYGDFVAAVTRKQAELAAQGTPTIRVPVDVNQFMAWCRRNRRQVNSQSRADYAGRIAAQQDGGGPPLDDEIK
jgi:hypothetical protein